MQGDVVDDGELNGGRGSSGDGLIRRQSCRVLAGYSGAIPAMEGQIEEGKGYWRVRGRRGGDWCAERGSGLAPFIGAQGGRGSAARSTAAMAFQGAKGQCDVRSRVLVSRQFWGVGRRGGGRSGACWRGRCLAAQVRENGEVVDGDRLREGTGAFLADCGCGGEAQRARMGSGGGVVRRGDRWPWRALVRAHAVIGMAWAVLGATRAVPVGFSSGHGGC
jgi:hypothetical protein